MIYTVESSAELHDVLAKVQGGDTIQLAAGDYGTLELSSKSDFDVVFDEAVTITSLDPSHPASFSRVKLNGVSNLTFDNIVFDYTYDSEHGIWSNQFGISNSSGITIKNSVFDGDVAEGRSEIDDGYGFGKGLQINDSSDIVIDNNEFTTWHRALTVGESTNITITNNDVHNIRSDGMDFSQVQGVLIEGNYFHDFTKSDASNDHMDMIQFFTTDPNIPSTDITIRDNILDIGDGDQTQSIFMRNGVVDQGLAGEEMFYQNVLIEGNVILNGHKHAISVGETNGLVIQNNTILSIDQTDSRFSSTPSINLSSASKFVVVSNNAVEAIHGYEDQPSWSVSMNAFIQNSDQDLPGHYSEQFIASSVSSENIADYVVSPGSLLDELSAGSPMNALVTDPDTLTPSFNVYASASDPSILIFDASTTYSATGEVLPEDATFLWDFGNGITGSGQVLGIGHHLVQAGTHRVSLTVSSESEGEKTVFADVAIAGEDVLYFDAVAGHFVSQGFGRETVIDESTQVAVATESGMVIDLGGEGSQLQIESHEIERFFGTDEFDISFGVKADQPDVSWGEIFRVHGSIVVVVEDDGSLMVQLSLDTGLIEVVVPDISLNDGAEHHVSIQFDGEMDRLEIFVDGELAVTETAIGELSDTDQRKLMIGNPWGKQNFDGKLTAFDLDASSQTLQEFTGEAPEILNGEVEGISAQSGSGFTPETEVDSGSGAESDIEVEPKSSPDDAALPDSDNFGRSFANLPKHETAAGLLQGGPVENEVYALSYGAKRAHLIDDAHASQIGRLPSHSMLQTSEFVWHDLDVLREIVIESKSGHLQDLIEGDSSFVRLGIWDAGFFKVDPSGGVQPFEPPENHETGVQISCFDLEDDVGFIPPIDDAFSLA